MFNEKQIVNYTTIYIWPNGATEKQETDTVCFSRQAFSHFPFKVYWLPENAQAELQAGVGVSNRHFGRAVDRNRIKRLMREAWRINKISLQRNLVDKNRRLSVFIIYTGNDLPVMENVSAKMKTLADRLQSLSDAVDQSPA